MTAKRPQPPNKNPDKPADSRTRQERQVLRRSINLLDKRADALGLFDPLDVEPSFCFHLEAQR
jgi:hypothetical protein